MHRKLLIGILILMFCSCSKSEKQESTSPSTFNSSDTLTVVGKSVVFFSISQPEYDELTKDTNSGVDEVLSDFNYYAELVSDTLKRDGYKPLMTASRFIKINLINNTSITFDRLSTKSSITGYIISDGKQEPIIEFGGGTDIDFLNTFNEYKNKNK